MPSDIIHGLVVGRIRGVAESRGALRKIVRLQARGCEVGVRVAMEYLLKESNKVTPIDTGALRESGTVEVIESGFETKGYIYYTAPYATYVHEDLTKWHAPGTYAKFLERTIRNPIHQAKASALIGATINAYVALYRTPQL